MSYIQQGAAAGGSGTVTSVGQTINSGASSGIFTVTGSPVTTTGTLDIATAGTSGGVPYFSSGTVVSSSAALTSNAVVLGGGAGATPKTATFLTTNGTTTLTVGVAAGGNGVLALAGNTSGTATLTAPATAGTVTNPIVFSNGITVPVGTQALPPISVAGSAATGFYGNGANIWTFSGNNTDVLSQFSGGTRYASGIPISWSSAGSTGSADTGISRSAAGEIAIGTGAAASTAGTLNFTTAKIQGKASTYNAIATVSNGIPAEYATVDLTAQTAAITATTLYAVPAAGLGMYRISWSATITTAASVSSVLGGTNGFQILYTSPTDSVVKTTVTGNSITSAANTTGTAVGGVEIVYAKASTNIQYQYDYTSSGTAMAYELHLKVEAL